MRLLPAAIIAVIVLASPAFAHTGAGHHFAFASGFAHPLMGLDHLLTMVGVGLLAALAGGPARTAWPVAFVTVMTVGGALALNGIAMPYVEAMVLASVIGVGAAITFGLRIPFAAGAALCAIFAIAHGHAHGTELPADASVAGYFAGFMFATASLHAAGIVLGVGLHRSVQFARITGGAIAAAGAMLAFA